MTKIEKFWNKWKDFEWNTRIFIEKKNLENRFVSLNKTQETLKWLLEDHPRDAKELTSAIQNIKKQILDIRETLQKFDQAEKLIAEMDQEEEKENKKQKKMKRTLKRKVKEIVDIENMKNDNQEEDEREVMQDYISTKQDHQE